jgi:phosphohistidine phosphatase
MQVLVIRHAIAEDKEQFQRTGESDDLRPLTPDGRRKMKSAARGLRALATEVDLLATSPLVRAVQTAEIVAEAYKNLKTTTARQLRPEERVQSVLKWLARHKRGSVVALVGHEPQLGILVGWLLTGLQKSFVEMKKGGACLIEMDESMRPGRAKLLWFLTPSQLRAIGGR